MKIGVPKEMENGEARIGLTHIGVKTLVSNGHEVFICSGCGEVSGITDEMYKRAGAKILEASEDVYKVADLLIKVKPPVEEEFSWFRRKQGMFAYILPERNKPLCDAFMEKEMTVFAYELVEDKKGGKPLLLPMSEIAGKMAVLLGSKFMQTIDGGKGLMLGFMTGISPSEVTILGAGSAGSAAALAACGLGCNVTILNRSLEKLKKLESSSNNKITTLYLSSDNILQSIKKADLVINTIDQMGNKESHLITREMIKSMKKGSVIIDIANDENGTIETSRPTSHDNPTYVVDGVIHCSIPNIPGIVPQTATMALTEATLPYIINIANRGFKDAALEDKGLRKGLCFFEGKLLHEKTAENFGLGLSSLD